MNGSFAPVDRLGFTLPDFIRHSWVSDNARRTWEPRLERIRRAWLDIEWLSIVDNIRRCALVGLAQDALAATIPKWSARQLSAIGLPVNPSGMHAGTTFVVVGNRADVTSAQEAWSARADDALGQLLGYPPCCRRFFEQVWVHDRSVDTTWAMATNTAAPVDAVVVLNSPQSHVANILWRWLGVRAVPHLPCRFDCGESAHFGERLLEAGHRAGYFQEVNWIRELLSWPVEWSALHGIAEVKTPILKISTRTDATASKYVVQWTGTDYPQDGITGLRFPYRSAAGRAMTEGRGFQLGLKQSIERPVFERSWYHLDNGFSSVAAMDELHEPIVDLARRTLTGVTGSVLDLGCGNAALLAKICEGLSGLTPCGVDASSAALAHAAVLLPRFAANFAVGDLFDPDILGRGPRHALALLMIGRLTEVDRPVADRLMKTLRTKADAILVYSYPGRQPLASVAEEMGLVLEDVVGEAALVGPSASAPDAIDWSRLAEPQADHYDTDIILQLASTTTSAARPQPYRRTPRDGGPSAFDGAVAIRHVYRNLPEFEAFSAHYVDAPVDHPNIAIAAEYVRRWPVAFAQCQRLLEAIHPSLDSRIPFESTEIYRGSSCHSFEPLFGTLWSTIFCPIGLAEAIVHEMAHQKLRVLGVSFESATAIVGNDPTKLYVSAIIKDRLRPMTAVVHAQYSYVHVTALDVHMLRAERDPATCAVLRVVLERNLARIVEGHDTIQEHFTPGEHGREFMGGFSRWTAMVMQSARELLG